MLTTYKEKKIKAGAPCVQTKNTAYANDLEIRELLISK